MKDLKKFAAVELKNVQIKDSFWSPLIKLVEEVAIPYQWEALNDRVPDAEPSHAIKNFRIAAGLEQGEYYGMVFQDTDVAKWLEAVGYYLQTKSNPELERIADETIDLIGKAQHEDGYLNTYFTVKEPGKQWTNLEECHELYTAGHMIEAAVAYYKATGKRKFLDIVCRLADYIDRVLGPEPGKMKGYDGHEEIELALAKLYDVTGEDRYLRLSKFFIDARGTEPYFFDEEFVKRGGKSHWPGVIQRDRKYSQAHLPVREQSKAVGHAVRAMYLYSGMADVAARTNDETLLQACRTLWDNTVTKRMYITGGIGSAAKGEAFTCDYDLPNDSAYAETCASIGLAMFALRMLKTEINNKYSDVIEKVFYNLLLSGMSADGKSFFYVNPLEVWPEANRNNPTLFHAKPVRQKWYGCACCPPNVVRTLTSLGEYIYSRDDDTIYTHLYIGGSADIDLNGSKISVCQKTNYPWDGNIHLQIFLPDAKEFTMALRIPGWCRKYGIRINGQDISAAGIIRNGYIYLKKQWKNNDQLELSLDMPVELMKTNPKVRENAGKAAIMRGPVVYCLEEIDNGENLSAISLPSDVELKPEYESGLLGGVVVIKGEALRTDESQWDESVLYQPVKVINKKVNITAVPYGKWGNRKPGEMLVWIRQEA